MLDWLKKMILEKWAGRAIVMLLTLIGGYMANYFPADVTANFIEALKVVLETALPLIIAWLLGMARQKVALDTPVK